MRSSWKKRFESWRSMMRICDLCGIGSLTCRGWRFFRTFTHTPYAIESKLTPSIMRLQKQMLI